MNPGVSVPKGSLDPYPRPFFRPALQKCLRKMDQVRRRIRHWSYQLFPPARNQDLFSIGSPAGAYALEAGGVSALSQEELENFRREGWIGPFAFLSPQGVKAAEKIYYGIYRQFRTMREPDLSQPDFFKEKPWSKSMQAHVPEYFDIARHPAIVERAASLLGPDLMAWGVALNFYRPGERHRWHVDVEHRQWTGVTVFLALSNISPGCTLKVISRSHRMEGMPQGSGIDDDASALKACREADPDAKLTAVPLKEGEFFIFDGRLWHGSKNETLRTRGAMILQYSRPDQKAKIPLNLNPPVRWHPQDPPCVLVKGADRWGVNRLVDRPG